MDAAEPTALPVPHILLICADADLIGSVRQALTERYELQTAATLQAAGAIATDFSPLLLLVDDTLGEDDVDLRARIGADAQLGAVPVIFLATVEPQEDLSGETLLKPFSARELLACVESQIKLARVRREMTEALHQSEARYRAIVEGQSEMVSRFRPDGTLLFINGAYARARGATPEELTGANFWDWIDEEDRPAVRAMIERITPESPEIRIENRFETSEGARWILWTNRALAFDEDGRPTELQSAGIDITDRKRAEEALRQSEQRFRLMADAAPAKIWITDVHRQFIWFNQKWLQFTGRDMEKELGDGWLENVHPEDYERVVETFTECFDARQTFSVEYRLRRHDGQYRWLLDNGIPYFSAGQEFSGYIGSCIDIHDRRIAEQELRRLNETLEERVEQRTRQVRQLLARLTMAEQEERRNVSQILHDNLQQLLYGIEMKVAMIEQDLQEVDRPRLLNDLQEARAWIGQAIATTRQLTIDLSPPILQDEGLADALEWLRSQMKELHGLHVDLQASHRFYLPDEDRRVLLFQVVRELLFNVKKHSGVNQATVRLAEEDDHLVIEVVDKGAGFDARAMALRTVQDRGFGLFNIRERLKLLGGGLDVLSSPNLGTRVKAKLPAHEKGAAR